MSSKCISIKRFVAILLTVFIILSLSLSFSGDASASEHDGLPVYDFYYKTMTNYIIPYAGFPANEVYCHQFKQVYPDSSDTNRYVYLDCGGEVYGKGLFDEKGKRLDDDDWLEEGKTYTYKAGFASKSKKIDKIKPLDIKDYKIKTIDLYTGQELSCKVSNVKNIKDGYYIDFEYTFTAYKLPSLDQGSITVDLTDGKYTAPDENTFQYICMSLIALGMDKKIAVSPAADGYSPEYDLDKNGSGDISCDYEGKSLTKLSTSNLNGSLKLELYSQTMSWLDKMVMNYDSRYYSSITFVFDKIDISNASVSGISDKTYTGSAITQSAVLTLDGNVLKEGTDYSVSYTNNVNPGTATVTYTGKGMYTGTVSKTFTITKSADNNTNINPDDIPEIKGTVHGDLASGLWVERPDGTYPVSQWGKVNGKLYYFDKRGYAAANEYADGKWFGADGVLDENYTMEWKSNDKGWWIEDKSGWYPVSRWLKIDGYWYYFLDNGYMDYSEYRDGCWLGSDGAWVEEYYGGHWCSNSSGWWYEDASGWYPVNTSVWIDGVNYSFGADGYMK